MDCYPRRHTGRVSMPLRDQSQVQFVLFRRQASSQQRSNLFRSAAAQVWDEQENPDSFRYWTFRGDRKFLIRILQNSCVVRHVSRSALQC